MRLSRLLTIAAIAGTFGIGTDAALAQVSQQGPAELPPASFAGKQYVDSKGCVFVRAGIDGGVSWVPRVTRDRQTVCGFRPSLAEVEAAPAPVKIIIATPAPAIAPEPRPVAVAPTPKVVRKVQAKPAPRVIRAVASPAQMIKPTLVSSVRRDGTVTGKTRIVPKHVAENRLNTRNVAVPKGYTTVWKDGRLNPHRAEQTLEGRAQMGLVWTNTLPRRLVDPRSGRKAAPSVPVIHPPLSGSQQSGTVGEVDIVQRNGKTVRRVISDHGTVRQPVYSSRSAPEKQLTAARYVQVATFRVSGNAQRAAQEIARMGMGARIGKYRKGGTTYLSVQAGPFVDTGRLTAAVKRLRKAGYSDAFAR